MPGDLPYMAALSGTENSTIPVAGEDYEFTPAQEGLTISSGSSLAFYIVVPDRVMVYDVSERYAWSSRPLKAYTAQKRLYKPQSNLHPNLVVS